MEQGNGKALLPIGVFLLIYLGLGILYEYIFAIPMGFYHVPILVAFLISLAVACLQNAEMTWEEKLEVMAKGVGDKNVIAMLLIFLTAGIFVGVAGRGSAESVAYFLLSFLPVRFSVTGLFLISGFVATAMGTSVGTITLMIPIAVAVAEHTGFELAPCIASIVGGAMFGDNLSFISDTTIAACNGQGCEMKDKFRENFKIALPAAIVTMGIIFIRTPTGDGLAQRVTGEYDLIRMIPYLLVLAGSMMGKNVFLVLFLGIVSGSVITLATKGAQPVELLTSMGQGAAGMLETAMVAILVSAMGALMAEKGGFRALLAIIKKIFRGKKGGSLGVGLLAGAMDIATANNTVAIVLANPIAREMAQEYHISPRKAASLLDTFSCIFQGMIPYGAQMLVAVSATMELGGQVSAFEILTSLYYPYMLLISSLVFIFILPEKEE